MTTKYAVGRAFPLPRGGGLGWGQQATRSATKAKHIAIHRKFQTRRVAEDSTHLYGEATQHRMRLSVDGYNSVATRSKPRRSTPLPRRTRQRPQRGRVGVGVAPVIPAPMQHRSTTTTHPTTAARSTAKQLPPPVGDWNSSRVVRESWGVVTGGAHGVYDGTIYIHLSAPCVCKCEQHRVRLGAPNR